MLKIRDQRAIAIMADGADNFVIYFRFDFIGWGNSLQKVKIPKIDLLAPVCAILWTTEICVRK